MNIGKAIRLRRMSLGVRQNCLADKAGISPQYLGLIEKGLRKNISMEILEAIAPVLKWKLITLLSHAEVKTKPKKKIRGKK